MKILVTGSSGQVGSYTVDHLREQGIETHGLDLRPSEWTTHVGDIRNPEDCITAAKGCDAIIHCAAHISVQGSIEDPVFDATTNVLGTLNMLQAAVACGVKRFVNVSSAAVYGNPQYVPIDEDHPLKPLSPYGASKVAAETYTAMFGELHGLDVVSVRPFNIYSPRQDPSNPYSGVISKFMSAGLAGKALAIHGDGSQTRDFVHAADISRALILLAECPLPPGQNTFNLGTQQAISIRDLADAVNKLTCNEAEVTVGPSRTGDIQDSLANIKAIRAIGWSGQASLLESLATLAD